MRTGLNIRAYHTPDKPKLMQILKRNAPAYFAYHEVDDFDQYLDHEIEEYFVVELNGEIVGSGGINLGDSGKTGKISWDMISPEFQGMGLGSRLLAHRMELLASMDGIDTISVRTSQHAYRFYEKNGFVLKEVHKDYWSPGYDLYYMVYKPNG